MTNVEWRNILKDLRDLEVETEVVEFKEATL